MNWKQILKTDVSTLLRGFAPPHVYHARHGRTWRGPVYRSRYAWRRDLLAVTEQVEAIIRCNAPLVRGVELAAWDAPRRQVQLVLQALHDDLASGHSLHESMALRTRFFPKYYVDLMKAGEITGSLKPSLARIREHIKLETQRSNTIWGWAAYLLLVGCAQLTVMTFLLVYVFPEFADVLGDFGTVPPAPFRWILAVSDAVTRWWDPLAALLLFLALIVPRTLLPYRGQTGFAGNGLWKGLASCIPILRRIVEKADWALFATVMERLLAAGIPLNEALRDCGDLGLAFKRRMTILRLKQRVEEGGALAAALAAEPGVPESFKTLVALGESSGHLPGAFARLAELYHQQVLKASRMLLDIGGPCGVLVLGSLVLIVEVALFGAVTGISDALVASL